MKLLFSIHINVTEVIEVKGKKDTARMVLFNGFAEGIFSGKVENGGVDTQKEIFGEAGTLSARYILSGKDEDGTPCKLFIENNGKFGEPYTCPKIITDSEKLGWLENAKLFGQICNENNELIIKIFEDN
ncbi:MAG: DUF3237 domain-containing protein [Treponema sp.]|nr:DUF3237 domain-containing protein [Treponema sp.]